MKMCLTDRTIFVTLLICFSILTGCKKKEGIFPSVGTIVESVYGSGNVKAEEQYNVVSSIPGILLKTHVKVGDTIKKGDPVFTIKNPVAEFTIENSQLALRRAEENLKNIKEMERQVDLIRNRYSQDSLMLERQKKLWEQNVGTKVQLEQTELAMKASKTEYSNRVAQLDQARTALRLDYETAKNNVRIAKENADGYIIRSETEGKIYTINPEEGEGITPQTILAVIGKQNKFLIELEIDENDIARVRTGQEIFVTMDSYKDSVFKAVVSKIYPIMNESTGTFKVEGVFTKAPEKLYPHLNLEANILIGKKQHVLLIPRDYLVDDTYVVLENGDKAKVGVGLKNFEFAEILSGLNKEQKILKP